jgi:hypothetical protein
MLSSDLITILNDYISKKYPNITVLNCFDTTNNNGKSNSVLKSYHMRYSSYITCINNVYKIIVTDRDLNNQVEIPLEKISNNNDERDFFMKLDSYDRKLYIVDKNDRKFAKFDNIPPTVSTDTGYLIIPELFICLIDDYGEIGVYYFLINIPTPDFIIDIKIKLLYKVGNTTSLAPTKFYSFTHSPSSKLNYTTDQLNTEYNSSIVNIYNSLYFCALDVNYNPVYLLRTIGNYLTNTLQAYPEGFLNLSLIDDDIRSTYNTLDYNRTPDQNTYNVIPTKVGLLKSGYITEGNTGIFNKSSTNPFYIPKNGYIKIVNITPKDATVNYYVYKDKEYRFYLDLSDADPEFDKKEVTKVYKTIYNVMNGYVIPVERKDSIITNLGITSLLLSPSALSDDDKRGNITSEYQLGYDFSLMFNNNFLIYINSDYSSITRKITTSTSSETIYDINRCNTNKIKIKCMCQSIQSNSIINTFIGVSNDNKVYVSNVLPTPATPEPWGSVLFSFSSMNIKIINTIKIEDTITTYYVIIGNVDNNNNNKLYIYYGPRSATRNYNLTSTSGTSNYWVEVPLTFFNYKGETIIDNAKILQIFQDIDNLQINRYIALVQYSITGGTETNLFSSTTLLKALKFKLGLITNNDSVFYKFLKFFRNEQYGKRYMADISIVPENFGSMYFIYPNCNSYNCFTDPKFPNDYKHYKLSEALEFSPSLSKDPEKKGIWENITTGFSDLTIYSYALSVYINTMDSLFIPYDNNSTTMYLYGYGLAPGNSNNQYAIYSVYIATDYNNTTYINRSLVNYIVGLNYVKNIFNIVNTYYSTNVPSGVDRITPTPDDTPMKNSNNITMMDIYTYSKNIKDSSGKMKFYNYIALCKYNNTDDAEIHYLTLK